MSGLKRRIADSTGIARIFGIAAIVFAVNACADATQPSLFGSTTNQVTRLMLNHKAVKLAVGQTVQLSFVGLNAKRDTIPTPGTVRWTVDPRYAEISPEGVFKAIAPNGSGTSTLNYIVSVQHDNVTRADTGRFIVTATAPTPLPERLDLISAELDTGYIGLGSLSGFSFRPLVYNGPSETDIVTNVPIYIFSSDPSVTGGSASLTSASMFANGYGTAKLYGKTHLYGVDLIDSTSLFRVTYPSGANLFWASFTSTFGNDPVIIRQFRPYGILCFGSGTTERSVTFDNPSMASQAPPGSPDTIGSGNIEPWTSGSRCRMFKTPGTVNLTTHNGQRGTITIMPNLYPGQ